MNTSNRTIIWEKWKDPFGFEDSSIENILENEDNENDEEVIQPVIKKIKCQVISTPLGMIPFNETLPSSDVFNFWTGHCNFAITKKILRLIENTPGVETLNVFTKYRFRISVGKAFSDSLVMRQINQNVYNYLETDQDYVK